VSLCASPGRHVRIYRRQRPLRRAIRAIGARHAIAGVERLRSSAAERLQTSALCRAPLPSMRVRGVSSMGLAQGSYPSPDSLRTQQTAGSCDQ